MLNERQKKLYEYLLEAAKKGEWRIRYIILKDLSEFYNIPIHPVHSVNMYYNANALQLTKDIKAINDDPDIEKVIISNSYKGVKIATEEELKVALEREMISCLKKFKGYWNKVRKYSLNNQITLDEQVIRTFIGDPNEKYSTEN